MAITTKEFEQFVASNAKMGLNEVAYSFVGLAGETGECMEWLKKKVLRNTPCKLTHEDLKLELGDVLHYVSRIGQAYHWTLDDIMAANVKKLKGRKGGWQ